jgi:hypothetical protein
VGSVWGRARDLRRLVIIVFFIFIRNLFIHTHLDALYDFYDIS